MKNEYTVSCDSKTYTFAQAMPARDKYNSLCGYDLVMLFKNEELVRYNKNGKETRINDKRGGKENAGQKYGEPTKRVSVRIPESIMKKIQDKALVTNTSQSTVIVRHLESL